MCNDTFLGSYHTKMKTSAQTCIGNNGITKKTLYLIIAVKIVLHVALQPTLARLLIVKLPTFN